MGAKRKDPKEPSSGNPSNIKLDAVNTLWLQVTPEERYLLLEDPETGDVLMPLIYMKAVLEANYSRKLASFKNRLVVVPKDSPLSAQDGLLYWQWAFESPHAVKVVVRRELGEENTPQGHLRLVILPIVYNAMAQKHALRHAPLFKALYRALKHSTYYRLLRHPPLDFVNELEAEEAQAIAAGGVPPGPLFHGPVTLEACALKYMFMFKDLQEVEASKRMRSGNFPGQEENSLAMKQILAAASAAAASSGLGPSATGAATGGGAGGTAAGGVGGANNGEVVSAFHPLPPSGQQAQQGQQQGQAQQASQGQHAQQVEALQPQQAQQQPHPPLQAQRSAGSSLGGPIAGPRVTAGTGPPQPFQQQSQVQQQQQSAFQALPPSQHAHQQTSFQRLPPPQQAQQAQQQLHQDQRLPILQRLSGTRQGAALHSALLQLQQQQQQQHQHQHQHQQAQQGASSLQGRACSQEEQGGAPQHLLQYQGSDPRYAALEQRLRHMEEEVALLKRCITQLYTLLAPGSEGLANTLFNPLAQHAQQEPLPVRQQAQLQGGQGISEHILSLLPDVLATVAGGGAPEAVSGGHPRQAPPLPTLGLRPVGYAPPPRPFGLDPPPPPPHPFMHPDVEWAQQQQQQQQQQGQGAGGGAGGGILHPLALRPAPSREWPLWEAQQAQQQQSATGAGPAGGGELGGVDGGAGALKPLRSHSSAPPVPKWGASLAAERPRQWEAQGQAQPLAFNGQGLHGAEAAPLPSQQQHRGAAAGAAAPPLAATAARAPPPHLPTAYLHGAQQASGGGLLEGGPGPGGVEQGGAKEEGLEGTTPHTGAPGSFSDVQQQQQEHEYQQQQQGHEYQQQHQQGPVALQQQEGGGRGAGPAWEEQAAPAGGPPAVGEDDGLSVLSRRLHDPLGSLNIMLQQLTDAHPSLGPALRSVGLGGGAGAGAAGGAGFESAGSLVLMDLLGQLSGHHMPFFGGGEGAGGGGEGGAKDSGAGAGAPPRQRPASPSQQQAQQQRSAGGLGAPGGAFAPYLQREGALEGARGWSRPRGLPAATTGGSQASAATASKAHGRSYSAGPEAAVELAYRLAELSQNAPPHPFMK